MLDANLRQKYFFDTEAALGAGAVTIDLRPPKGAFWIIQAAWCYHVSGGARVVEWLVETPEDPGRSAVYAAAASDYSAYGLDWISTGLIAGTVARPIVLTNRRYATARLTATGAGDDLYVKAWYLEGYGGYQES